jgi:L-ribulose-5-phosphate 3-epimerase
MIKSINQWSFPASMTAVACLLYAQKTGYEGFEPAFNETGELSLQGFEKDARALRRLAVDEGMKLTSLASGLYWTYPLTATDETVRKKAQEIIRRQIDCAKELGVDAILVVPGTVGRGFWGGSDSVRYQDAYPRALEGLAAAAPYAEEAGVTIGVENVWNNFLLSPLEMARLIDEVGSKRVGAYFDIGNVLLFGEAEHWIEALGSRIVRMHVKDFKRSVGTLAGFCDLMAGDVNFPAVMAACRKIGYDGPLTAEMGLYNDYPLALVAQTSRALDIILER